jgi:hypothetical protein
MLKMEQYDIFWQHRYYEHNTNHKKIGCTFTLKNLLLQIINNVEKAMVNIIIYINGIQPGVCVPLGVHEDISGGT